MDRSRRSAQHGSQHKRQINGQIGIAHFKCSPFNCSLQFALLTLLPQLRFTSITRWIESSKCKLVHFSLLSLSLSLCPGFSLSRSLATFEATLFFLAVSLGLLLLLFYCECPSVHLCHSILCLPILWSHQSLDSQWHCLSVSPVLLSIVANEANDWSERIIDDLVARISPFLLLMVASWRHF